MGPQRAPGWHIIRTQGLNSGWRRKESRGPGHANTSGRELGASERGRVKEDGNREQLRGCVCASRPTAYEMYAEHQNYRGHHQHVGG